MSCSHLLLPHSPSLWCWTFQGHCDANPKKHNGHRCTASVQANCKSGLQKINGNIITTGTENCTFVVSLAADRHVLSLGCTVDTRRTELRTATARIQNDNDFNSIQSHHWAVRLYRVREIEFEEQGTAN